MNAGVVIFAGIRKSSYSKCTTKLVSTKFYLERYATIHATIHNRYRNRGKETERLGVRHGECDWQTHTEQFIVWYLVKDVSTIFIIILTGHAGWQITYKVFCLRMIKALP